MKAKTTIDLYAQAAGGQGGSSKIGRNYQVVDKQYGFVVHKDKTPSEAETAALARPYTKVVSQPDVSTTPEVRDLARKRLVKTNPDVDAAGMDGLEKMMEDRMFCKEESGKGWVTYSRGDNSHEKDGWRRGRWIKIFFEGNRIGKVICHSDEGPVRVKHGWDAVQGFTQAYGD